MLKNRFLGTFRFLINKKMLKKLLKLNNKKNSISAVSFNHHYLKDQGLLSVNL